MFDWSQQYTGRDWVHHKTQPGIDRKERRLLPGKRDSQRQQCPFRRISPLATLGALIMTLTRPWIDKVRMSLASGATTHPFQEADLEELRAILGPRHLHERCPGQPFLLDLVSHLASLSGDPDWEFPLTLKEGVPLGVSDPTLTSPGVWPTKEELKGEAGWGKTPPRQWLMITTQRLNSLPRKSNQPFTRNEPWTWWTGPSLAPRRRRGAVANRRNFARAPLQGLMSRTRSGRSTMAQKGEQTHTSRLTQRRRPLHRWSETASTPSTGSGQRRATPIYFGPRPRTLRRDFGMSTSRCRGSPQVPRALIGAGGLWIPPAAWTSPWDRHPQERGHSQVPRALIGGPPSPHPFRARNALGGAGGNP